MSVKRLMQLAIRNYNERFHSTIKSIPKEVQNRTVDFEKIKENLKTVKLKNLSRLNKKREEYQEERSTGFIKNYKAVRHKEQPKYKKMNLNNIHIANIKRSPKFFILGNNTD